MATFIDDLRVHAFRVPTEEPESDGTAEWDSHTLVLVEVTSGDTTGIGYAYTHAAAARLVDPAVGLFVSRKQEVTKR
jgi:hypothetical protein